MKELLSQNNIEFSFVEITDSILNLRAFLRLRDNEPAFAEVRQAGRVGLPCIVINDGEKIIIGQPDLDELR